MRFSRVLSFTLLAVAALRALAGAWGTGAFQNDDALDWVWELTASSGSTAIEEALRPAASPDGYIEAPSGANAIAAAEVLAAVRGKPPNELPPEVSEWVDSQRFEPSSELLAAAREAVKNVRDPKRSELAELWSDAGGEDDDRWQQELTALAVRLK